VRAPEEELRGAVPPRGDVVGDGLVALGEGPGEAKVAELEVPGGGAGGVGRRVDEEVLGLDVAVHDVVLVAPRHGAGELVDVLPHELQWEAAGVLLEDLQEVLLHILKDEVKLLLSPKSFLKTNNVLLTQTSKHFHFPESGLAHYLILITFLELFHSNDFRGFFVAALQNNTVCSFSDDTNNFVFVHCCCRII